MRYFARSAIACIILLGFTLSASSRTSGLTRPTTPSSSLYLPIKWSSDAKIDPPMRELRPGGVIETGYSGTVILEWPYELGRTTVSPCTRLELIEATHTANGGVRVFWRISQVPMCLRSSNVSSDMATRHSVISSSNRRVNRGIETR